MKPSTYCTQYTVHCTQYTVYCTLYTVHSTQYTVFFFFTLYTVHSTPYTVHRTQYTVHCTLYTVHSTLYTVHCTQCSTNRACTLCTVEPLIQNLSDKGHSLRPQQFPPRCLNTFRTLKRITTSPQRTEAAEHVISPMCPLYGGSTVLLQLLYYCIRQPEVTFELNYVMPKCTHAAILFLHHPYKMEY